MAGQGVAGGTVVVAPDVHAADRRDLPEVLDEEVAVLWLQGISQLATAVRHRAATALAAAVEA
ncbi:hypothetical protein GCM10029964_068090 [Kibdelosporangium lantanae]